MSNGTAVKLSKLYEIQDQLVRRAEDLVAARAKSTGLTKSGKTQMSRAIGTASAPGITPRVFINWLRYQAAREKDQDRFWTLQPDSGRSLAEDVAEQIAWIERQVDERDRMAAIARFLGYMRRALVGIDLLQTISIP